MYALSSDEQIVCKNTRRNELTDVCEIMGKVARVRPHIERNSVENRLVYKLVFYFREGVLYLNCTLWCTHISREQCLLKPAVVLLAG